MLKNYLKIAFRNFKKQKIYSFINIIGLTVSLTSCIFIYLYVQNEFLYDSFHKDSNKIFRVMHKYDNSHYSRISNLVSGELIKETPEIEKYSKFWENEYAVNINGDIFKEKITFADQGFLDVFSFPFIYGNTNNALKDRYSAILSEKAAEKYFGKKNPIGGKISIKIDENFYDFTISAITKDFPSNSSIQFSILLPFENSSSTWQMQASDKMAMVPDMAPSLFIKLKNPDQKKTVESGISLIAKKMLDKNTADKSNLYLQKLSELHFDNLSEYNIFPTGNRIYSYILICLSLFSLFIAAANFINLSIAGSSKRFKEIGVRKVIGTDRKNIFVQFILETLLLSLISLILSVVLVEILLPVFNNLINTKLTFNYYSDWFTILVLIILTAFIGLVSGSYPAIYLSRINPVSVLKGKQVFKNSGLFTKILVVGQFVISISLITGALIMSGQMNYIQNKNLGFNKDRTIVLRLSNYKKNIWGANNSSTNQLSEIFKSELTRYNSFSSVSSASDAPFEYSAVAFRFDYGENNSIPSHILTIDYDFIRTLNMNLIEGRNFDKSFTADSNESIIVNETFVKGLQIKNPIDKVVTIFGLKHSINKRIIGVIKDFNFSSLYKKGDAFALSLKGNANNYVYIKLKSDDIFNSVRIIKEKWAQIFPFSPIDYFFLDDFINKQYVIEERWNKIINYSAGFAIFTACLGLLGLVSLAAERRTKEIGIRKVFGASIKGIILDFSKEYLILISIGALIAWPVVYFILNKWLETFAYRIQINIMSFIVSAAIILILVFLTVGYHSWRAAIANPVKSLRYE
jgi:putative ABC transport system permease protein